MHDILRDFAVWVAAFFATAILYLALVHFAASWLRAYKAKRSQPRRADDVVSLQHATAEFDHAATALEMMQRKL